MSSIITLHDIVAPIVAGDNAGAGALDVECVRDITDRDLSKNSTMVYFEERSSHVFSSRIPPLTLASTSALNRLSIPSVNESSYGTTKVGTVATRV